LVIPSQVRAVDLLGKTEFRVGAGVSAWAVGAGKCAFRRVGSRVALHYIVCIRAVITTGADELNIVIDWGVVASGDVGLAASQGANLVFGTGYASRSVPPLTVCACVRVGCAVLIVRTSSLRGRAFRTKTSTCTWRACYSVTIVTFVANFARRS